MVHISVFPIKYKFIILCFRRLPFPLLFLRSIFVDISFSSPFARRFWVVVYLSFCNNNFLNIHINCGAGVRCFYLPRDNVFGYLQWRPCVVFGILSYYRFSCSLSAYSHMEVLRA